MRNIQLGIDTELIVSNKKGIVWPHQVGIPQERKDTKHVFDWHGDGFAWELCVAPSTAVDTIREYAARGISSLYAAQNIQYAQGASIYQVPASVVREAPEIVQRLGCAPSYNVYGNEASPKGLGKTKRTTGCHLHISSPDINKDNYKNVIKWADVLVGSTWTAISPESIIDERKRRKYYGKAGEYRVRFYDDAKTLLGVEYRVLPGAVMHHPAYLVLMLKLFRYSAHLADKQGCPDIMMTHYAVTAIQRADRKNNLYNHINIPPQLKQDIEEVSKLKVTTLDINAWRKIA